MKKVLCQVGDFVACSVAVIAALVVTVVNAAILVFGFVASVSGVVLLLLGA